jgi:hypothetical protein
MSSLDWPPLAKGMWLPHISVHCLPIKFFLWLPEIFDQIHKSRWRKKIAFRFEYEKRGGIRIFKRRYYKKLSTNIHPGPKI